MMKKTMLKKRERTIRRAGEFKNLMRKQRTMKASIIIPAYNEAERLGGVLGRIPRGYEVVVVDDGSTDGTAAVARSCGARVIRLSRNRGKMHACLEGAQRSRGDACIFLDGDGQHFPEDIPRVARALENADMVIGVRRMRTLPLHRRLSNWYARSLISFVSGRTFPDALSGFRGIRTQKLAQLSFEKGGYFFESEMDVQAARAGFSIAFVPIKVSYEYGANMSAAKSAEIAAWLLARCLGKLAGFR